LYTIPYMSKEENKRVTPVIEEIVEENSQGKEFLEQEKPRPKFKLLFFIGLLTSLIVGLLAGGIFVYFRGIGTLQNSLPLSTATPVSFATPAPTPLSSPFQEEKIDFSVYKINVLNGSGIKGEAARAKSLLEREGFKILHLGNAQSFDFQSTLIQAKEDVPLDVINKLKEVLLEEYAAETGDTLQDTGNFDIKITVGSE